MDSLRAWNGLPGNDISIGQKLVVSQPPAPVKQSIAKAVETPEVISDEVVSEPLEEGPTHEKEAETEIDSNRSASPEPLVRRESDLETKSYTSSEEVAESGLAEVIAGTSDTRKYLALHRTAKVGTIMKVINEMNGRQVFVRVSGKLPETGINDKLLIKISQSAYNRLGAIDKRFRVKVTYYNH